jgi:hypothetical protein
MIDYWQLQSDKMELGQTHCNSEHGSSVLCGVGGDLNTEEQYA